MRKDIKSELKRRFLTAMIVAPTLAVMLMSATYQLAAGLSGYGVSTGLPLMLGGLTILALLASLVLGTVWEKRLPLALLAVIFWLCFFSYLGIVVSGTTDFVADRFFEALTMVFSLPVFSYMSVASLFHDGASVAALVMTGLLALLSTAAIVYVTVKRRRGNGRG
ncbi:MAG: hypothetical protein E7630_05890 [Ruminococcaceae bacterium]|nr:hypothetical protein [Oscillospiraceae bacterium]